MIPPHGGAHSFLTSYSCSRRGRLRNNDGDPGDGRGWRRAAGGAGRDDRGDGLRGALPRDWRSPDCRLSAAAAAAAGISGPGPRGYYGAEYPTTATQLQLPYLLEGLQAARLQLGHLPVEEVPLLLLKVRITELYGGY